MRRILPSIALLLSFGLGCGGLSATYVDRSGARQYRALRGPPAAAARRASNEIPCPNQNLVVRDLGSGGFAVEGCGERITYTCHLNVCDPDRRESIADIDAQPTNAAPIVRVGHAGLETTAAANASGASPEVDRAARAAVDARALAILACVEDTALAFELSWTSEGRLDASLRGSRHGTPEEGCVRAIVQALSIAAPGSSGTIVHAVQR